MTFDLITFSGDPAQAREVLEAGASAVLVDWETADKALRQQGADTEINEFGVSELAAVRRATEGNLICRVNPLTADSPAEIDAAVRAGAQEIFLPMVRRVDEAERLIDLTSGRARPSILIETLDAVRLAPELGRLPLSRIYVGLTDLTIDLGSSEIFQALADGILDRMRPHIHTDFGFGGLTLPDRGAPIPCRLLMSEMSRLNCQFTFLRRSFWRDAPEVGLPTAIARIRAGLSEAFALGASALEENRRLLCGRVSRPNPLVGGP